MVTSEKRQEYSSQLGVVIDKAREKFVDRCAEKDKIILTEFVWVGCFSFFHSNILGRECVLNGISHQFSISCLRVIRNEYLQSSHHINHSYSSIIMVLFKII